MPLSLSFFCTKIKKMGKKHFFFAKLVHFFVRKRYLNYLCTNYLWSKGCKRFNIRTIINPIPPNPISPKSCKRFNIRTIINHESGNLSTAPGCKRFNIRTIINTKTRIMKKIKNILLPVLAIIAIISFFFVISDFIIKTTITGFYAMFIFAISASLWFVLGLSIFEDENPSNGKPLDGFGAFSNFSDDGDGGD